MPAKPKAEDVLRIGAEFDADSVIDGMQKMGTDWGKRMRRIEKVSRESMKGAGKSIKQFMWQTKGASKAYKRLAEDQGRAFKEIRGEYTKSLREVREYAKAVADAKNNIEMAKSTSLFEGGSENMEKLNSELAEAQKKLEKAQATSEKLGRKRTEGLEGVKEIKEASTFDRESIVDAFSDAAGELWGPFESLLHKDLPGAIEKGGKLAGHGWEHIFKWGGKITKNLGKAGEEFAKKSKAKGGIGGAAGAMGGNALAGMMKGMSGMLNVVSKLGPLIATASSLVVGLVQLFLDADAAAKDFNKEIMSTSGNAEFLNKAMGDGAKASENMKSTLSDMYSQATSFSKNYSWGITKEQFIATSNALTAEGVSLGKLDAQYKSSSGDVKNFGDLVRMSVGYSSAFGVSLQELNQFQGEMMSDLGMNLDQVEAGFQGMLRGAEESGIATQKFFGIIRGFSTDLTYFTTRMESVTKVMTALGRAMSPKDAQKFLQGITGFFKGKGLGELTVDVLMGGGAGETNARLQKSMDSKLGSLVSDISGIVPDQADDKGNKAPLNVNSMKKVLKKSDKDLAKWLANDGAKLSDDQKKAIQEASVQQQKILSGNPVDTASALEAADPFETMEQLEAQSKHILGVGLDKLTGVNRLAAESVLKLTNEQQKGFKLLNQGIEGMKATLVHKLKEGDRLQELMNKATDPAEKKALQAQLDAVALTDDERAAVDKLNAIAGKTLTADEIDAKDSRAVWNAMDKKQQDLIKDGKKTITAEEQMASNTTSINTQLQILVDFLMGAFYHAVIGIKDFVEKIGAKLIQPDTDAMELSKLERNAVQHGNADMLKAIKEGDGTLKGTLDKLKEAADSIQKDIGKETDPKKRAALEKRLHDVLQKNTNSQDQVMGAQQSLTTATEESNDAKNGAAAGSVLGSVALPGIGTVLGGAIGAVVGPEIKKYMNPDSGGGGSSWDEDTAAAATASGQKQAVPSAEAAAKAGITGGSLYTHDITAEGNQADLLSEVSDQGDTLSDIWQALRMRGIKLDKPFLENNVKKVFTDATYSAASDALTDYYFLSQADSKSVIAAVQKGADPRSLGKEIQKRVVGDNAKGVKGMSVDDALKDVANTAAMTSKMGGGMPNMQLPGHADGGMVTAVAGGMASVRPAPGEGLASVGKGETIGKAGGGGRGGAQVVELRLKGDLARIIDARSQNTINNHERMKTRR